MNVLWWRWCFDEPLSNEDMELFDDISGVADLRDIMATLSDTDLDDSSSAEDVETLIDADLDNFSSADDQDETLSTLGEMNLDDFSSAEDVTVTS